MNLVLFALVMYLVLAAVLYIRYESTDHVTNKAKPPRRYIRFAVPWYYSTPLGCKGNWFFGFWNLRCRRGFPEIGIRILGFEYWVEYWQ